MSVYLPLLIPKRARHGSTPRVDHNWVEPLSFPQEPLGRIGRLSGEYLPLHLADRRSGQLADIPYRALSELVGQPLPYDDVLTLRDRMWDISPTLVRYDMAEPTSLEIQKVGLDLLSSLKSSASSSSQAFVKPITDFYRTDPISRASVTMAACSKSFTRKEHVSANAIDDLGTEQAAFA